MKTKTRSARINVDDVSHDALTIVVHFSGNIATKRHSTCTREVSKGTKKRRWSERGGQSRGLPGSVRRKITSRGKPRLALLQVIAVVAPGGRGGGLT